MIVNLPRQGPHHGEAIRTRIHQYRAPKLRRSWFFLLITALGTFVAYALAYAAFAMLCFVTIKTLSFPPPGYREVFPAFMAIAGPILWIWFMWRLPHRIEPHFQVRRRRLAAVEQHPQGASRFPHRVLEAAWYRRQGVSAAVASKLRRCPPGCVILVNYPGPGDTIPPIPADRAFEPVDIGDETELWALLELSQGAPIPKTTPPEGADSSSDVRPAWRRILGALWSVMSQTASVAGLLFWPVLLLLEAWRADGLERAFYLGIILILVGIPVLRGLLVERRWWLVPGGLVYRENRVWRKRTELKLFTPATTPLLLNWWSDAGFVVDGPRIRRFECGELAAWVTVAAWRSPGRTPTLEELRVLLVGSKRRE